METADGDDPPEMTEAEKIDKHVQKSKLAQMDALMEQMKQSKVEDEGKQVIHNITLNHTPTNFVCE